MKTAGALAVIAGWMVAACGASSGAPAASAGGGADGSAQGSGGDSGAPPPGPGDGGAAGDAGGAASNDTADGVLTNLFGSRSGPSGTFAAPAFAHGFAARAKTAAGANVLTVYFTNYPDGCAYARAGGFLEGGETFALSIATASGDVASMTEYTGGQASSPAAVQDAPTTWTAGVNCAAPGSDAAVPAPAATSTPSDGAVLIYSFDSARVTGHFSFVQTGSLAPIDGIFDVPLCDLPDAGAPAAGGDAGASGPTYACVPQTPGAPANAPTTPCAGVAASSAAGGTLTGVTGSRSGPGGTFPSPAFDTGFATIEPVSLYGAGSVTTLYLTFADYPVSCGDGLAGVYANGGHTFEVWASEDSTDGAPPAFPAGTYANVGSDSYPQAWPAMANGECVDDRPPAAEGTGSTITVSVIDSSHVAGTFQIAASGDAGAVGGTYDLPICNPPAYDGGAPQLCCL